MDSEIGKDDKTTKPVGKYVKQWGSQALIGTTFPKGILAQYIKMENGQTL